MNKEFKNIIFSIENQVAKISLNRPDVLNSFNYHMADEVIMAFMHCKENKNIRAIILTGEGRAFCAGQDLEEATGLNAPSIDKIIEHTYNPILEAIRSIEKPVICAVNGVAAGAGANIAIACDITIASESSKFIQSFTNIGLIPDSGGTFFLPRLIGHQKASMLMFSGDKISAKEAEEIGMIYKCVSDSELQIVCNDIALKLAKKPTKSIGLTKKLLNSSFSNNLNEQLEIEKKSQAISAKTEDHIEGIKAFFEKRKPNYKGN
jgi:2-(1,2-epoxy-1,2-dihydrophenyl)acetyl-CoA isomerase